MQKDVLYTDHHGKVFVVDLPASIEIAQGAKEQTLSTEPLRQPYKTPEPKGKKREAVLALIPCTYRSYHDSIGRELKSVLEGVTSDASTSSWLLPRWTLSVLAPPNLAKAPSEPPGETAPPVVLPPTTNVFNSLDLLQSVVVVNANDCRSIVCITDYKSFRIPSNCVFLNATLEHGQAMFEDATWRFISPLHEGRQLRFDLILMDPPWRNRSVRHAKSYVTAESQEIDPFTQAAEVVDKYLAFAGFVAIWTTNNETVHKNACEKMRALNLSVVEEWIWLKVTSAGEPIMPLDGVWRKPYEILLLFHRSPEVTRLPCRRFILAVPDFHSRKPNLNFMFNRLLPTNYLAIELFARSLTSGWWAWGDEVLKFQEESFWRQREP